MLLSGARRIQVQLPQTEPQIAVLYSWFERAYSAKEDRILYKAHRKQKKSYSQFLDPQENEFSLEVF